MRLLNDVGLWLSQKIKDHFKTQSELEINLKYIGWVVWVCFRSKMGLGLDVPYFGFWAALLVFRQTFLGLFPVQRPLHEAQHLSCFLPVALSPRSCSKRRGERLNARLPNWPR